MNDFTKEELEEISSAMSWMENEQSGLVEDNVIKLWHAIDSKLEKLIDNYCAHDGEIGKDYPAEKCLKCNMMWE
jgi:hypothetical protein